ncbi:MAG: hypothetical protein ACI4IQ_07750, partial [Eubacterium sp.]
MNNDDMNKILKNAQKKTGVDISKMKQAAENGNLDDFINKNLSPDASQQIKNVLSDKSAAEKLLSTPQAKELMKKLMEG